MALKTTIDLNVDFYDKKYILINAKQLDKSSRFLSVTCYNHGNLYPINAGEHSAYIRYKKPDGYSVFNFCEINNKGKIIVELTEQMLACDGVCYADLVIVQKGDAEVNEETGEIVGINNTGILSTMTFCIDVSEVPVLNSEIEASSEFIQFNEDLETYWANFEDVMKTAKSWAVGGTGIKDRPDENTNNSKYYSQLSKSYAIGNANNIRENENVDNAKYYCELSDTNKTNAANSAKAAATSESNALISENNAKESETKAATSEQNAKVSETNAKTSEANAKTSEVNSKTSEVNASASEEKAKTSEANALTSEQNAKSSETNALNNANKAQSYAVGGTGTRANEDTDNAHYYYELIKSVVNGLNSGFIPMGTISFDELATAEKATGYSYNISDDFITDDTFAEGTGKSYTAGTNVYCRLDGLWDCFGGSATPIATVDEVKEYLGINLEIT